jgi:hypothetical protein
MLKPLPDGADAFGLKKLGLKPAERKIPLIRSAWMLFKRSRRLVGSFLMSDDVLIWFACF